MAEATTKSDRDLIEAALRARQRGDCLSVIVGTDAAGERKLHAEPGTPRAQLFRSRLARSQVIDPSRWN